MSNQHSSSDVLVFDLRRLHGPHDADIFNQVLGYQRKAPLGLH